MKKILILIPRMGGGGAERVVSILANRFSDNYSIQITTLVSDKSFYKLNNKIKFTSAKIDINRTNKITRLVSMGKSFVKSILFTRKTVNEYKPDIVFSLLEEMDIVTYLATRRIHGFKWICSERNDPNRRNKKLQWLLEKIYRKCDMLVCQSHRVSDYYSMVKNKCIIPNPVDFNEYPSREEESYPPRIVAVGRLVLQKNFVMLIEAFSCITQNFPSVTLTIYGEGPERKNLEKLIVDKKIQNKINLYGASHKVLENISNAAVFAFPTNYEGFPNVLVEAVAMGIPVISTDFATGIAREIIDDNVGILVPCGDLNAFIKALSELLSNGKRREHIRKVSHKAVERFAVEKVIIIWEKLFKRLLEVR